ncbi:MAG TPA: ATP-binding cassette domain-containing protein [Thermoplasmatales archaeon]|nr:ATP-binding cassette domain-containing protein [Thermoplasmatales archaeon]
MPAIEVRNLVKRFGSIVAVNGISLEIEYGEIFALLGPNGAGKTTTISILATLLKPTSGEAKINGYDVVKEAAKVRQSIGIVFQDPSLDDRLTARENLDIHGRLYHMSREERHRRIEEVLEMVELLDRADSIVKTFSGGMRRRLEIARGLMHKPKVLFLDEPTLGLDPQTRRHIWEYVEKLRDEGVTVLLTTHYMEEADYLADRIAIIDAGKIVAEGTPSELKDSVGGDIIKIKCSNAENMLEKLVANGFNATLVDDEIVIKAKEAEKMIPKIFAIADEEVKSITYKEPSLEDVFIHYTGRAFRDEEVDEIEASKMKWRMRR